MCGLSLVAASAGSSSLQCVGFSLQWFLLLQSTGSRVHGLQWLCQSGLVAAQHVEFSRPEIEPVSPALTGRFLPTAPPGKSSPCYFYSSRIFHCDARGSGEAGAITTGGPAFQTGKQSGQVQSVLPLDWAVGGIIGQGVSWGAPRARIGCPSLSEISSILVAWSCNFLNLSLPQPWLQVCWLLAEGSRG